LHEAVQRGDVIRVISDPTNMKNLFRTNSAGQFIDNLQAPILNLSTDPAALKQQLLVKGVITPFGQEVQLLESLGKSFDSQTFVFR